MFPMCCVVALVTGLWIRMRWPVRQRREVAAKCDWQENNCVEEEENARRLIYATGKGKKKKEKKKDCIHNPKL